MDDKNHNFIVQQMKDKEGEGIHKPMEVKSFKEWGFNAQNLGNESGK
jgi:hypothetical protein